MTRTCRTCGRPIEEAADRPGRTAEYCSQACRQRAYRERRRPAEPPAADLLGELGRRLGQVRLTPAASLHADVEDLSGRFARLRRVARAAAESENVTEPFVTNAVTNPAGDTSADADFERLAEAHTRELRVHCYRMLGSYDEAEDLTQETLLRAWRARDTLAAADNPRAWLYRVATNACLDFLRRADRRPGTYTPVPGVDSGGGRPPAALPWLQPFPDDELPEPSAAAREPDDEAVAGETLELIFLTAIQHLPPRQRAAVILRDVAGWSAAETADLLGTTRAAADSAVQRARAGLRAALPERREDWSARSSGRGPSAQERELLRRYMDAAARADVDAMVDLVREDAVLTMPPNPFWFTSREAIMAFVRPNLDPASPMFAGHWRHLPVRANGQPAVAGYLRRPGTRVFRAQLIDVLRLGDDGRIAEITTFEPHLFPAFGLPMTLGTRGTGDR
jgi:RNA polymerase sigma-70 factor (ECF subfamily)